MAKSGISAQMRRSVILREISEGEVSGPREVIAPAATRMDTNIDCQKEKKRIPLTQRNLGIGLRKFFSHAARWKEEGENTLPKGFEIFVYTHPKHGQTV